jgi:addiction module HigA family antidote
MTTIDEGTPLANASRPIHPGEILREQLTELGLSANALASALRVPTNRVTSILNEQRSITADTALRLARYFGTTAEFWMNLQINYELRLAESKSGERIGREVQTRPA